MEGVRQSGRSIGRQSSWTAGVTVASLLACGCASGGTGTVVTEEWTRSAIVPAPTLPASTGRAIDEGRLRVAGEASPVLLLGPQYTAEPDESKDPAALWVPRVQLGASVYYAASSVFEYGMHARYASQKWAERNTGEVEDIPGDGAAAYAFGVGGRSNIRLDDSGLTASVIVEVDWAVATQFVKHKRWSVDAMECMNRACEEGDHYDDDESVEHPTSPAFLIGLQLEGYVTDALVLFAAAGAQTVVRNEGYRSFVYESQGEHEAGTPDAPSSLKLGSAAYVAAGLEWEIGDGFVLASLFYPFAQDAYMDLGPALVLSGGLHLLEGEDAAGGP